ncbi:hypothetical protein PVK06_023640 [Gossypium arboreum]|uniref:RNase H type-1 domain-containing protein n=1 Tax=Gossypium arboreum TaxID=29729 RepID=A0ABR0PBW6_GOSAR|nr:hypothetical protein PVK06_023640 [Gossypium arboreum]
MNYEGNKYFMQYLVDFIRGYCQEISSCHTNLQVCSVPIRNQLWRPPDSGLVKLNFDASFLKDSRVSFTAVLVRNNEGKFLGACTYPFREVVDATVAEARACKRAMIFTANIGGNELFWKKTL